MEYSTARRTLVMFSRSAELQLPGKAKSKDVLHCMSTAEAEYVVLSSAAQESVWLRV